MRSTGSATSTASRAGSAPVASKESVVVGALCTATCAWIYTLLSVFVLHKERASLMHTPVFQLRSPVSSITTTTTTTTTTVGDACPALPAVSLADVVSSAMDVGGSHVCEPLSKLAHGGWYVVCVDIGVRESWSVAAVAAQPSLAAGSGPHPCPHPFPHPCRDADDGSSWCRVRAVEGGAGDGATTGRREWLRHCVVCARPLKGKDWTGGVRLSMFPARTLDVVSVSVEGLRDGGRLSVQSEGASGSQADASSCSSAGSDATARRVDHGDDEAAVVSSWPLPSTSLSSLWSSLTLERGLRWRLVEQVEASLDLAAAGVHRDAVGWNKIILLHGPPGTGKTSLCRAVCQHLGARLMQRRYVPRRAGAGGGGGARDAAARSAATGGCEEGVRFVSVKLLEVSSSCLYSKWFSESAKSVSRVFDLVERVAAEHEDELVALLFDEVEGVVHGRTGQLHSGHASRGSGGVSQPTDAVRAVNAMLTRLDDVGHRFPNVFMFCTSNVVRLIDAAFLDRVDAKFALMPPSSEVCYALMV